MCALASSSNLNNYFIAGESLYLEEGSHCEFKGHRNFAIEELPPRAIEKKSRTAISRNICGFLNSGLNGTIFVGILDNGIVEGIPLTEYQCDHVQLSVADTLERFNPPLSKSQCDIRIVPVISNGEQIPNSFRETSRIIKKQPHILRTFRKCWCDYEAKAAFDHGVVSHKFILIINVNSFNKERIIYQAEDGQIYFRKHTTLVKYSFPDIESQCREEVRLSLMPELSQAWRTYHIIKELRNIIEEGIRKNSTSITNNCKINKKS